MALVNKTPATVFVLIGLLTLTGVGGAGVCYWQYTGLMDKEKQVDLRREEVGDEKTLQSKYEETYIELENAKREVQFLEKSVSPSWYVPTLLRQLEHGAEECNLRLISVRPQPAPAQNKAKTEKNEAKKTEDGKEVEEPKKIEKKLPYKELNIQISVVGNFWNIQTFMNNLDRFPKILAITRVQINPIMAGQSRLNTGLLSADFTVKAFVFQEPETNTESKGGE